MKKLSLLVLAALSLASASSGVTAAPEKSRQEIVAERGPAVMPFDLQATTHIFTRTKSGGIQQVVAKNGRNEEQIRLIRTHLQEIAVQFSKGDFSGPTQIHGADMPGLAELKNARRSAIKVQYQEMKDGAKIVYTTSQPRLVNALHEWFDAQVSDHGHHAMEGHDHSKMHAR
nr:aspartate carbamoyltransferase [uncultured Noviherbaspirillum sp.]